MEQAAKIREERRAHQAKLAESKTLTWRAKVRGPPWKMVGSAGQAFAAMSCMDMLKIGLYVNELFTPLPALAQGSSGGLFACTCCLVWRCLPRHVLHVQMSKVPEVQHKSLWHEPSDAKHQRHRACL